MKKHTIHPVSKAIDSLKKFVASEGIPHPMKISIDPTMSSCLPPCKPRIRTDENGEVIIICCCPEDPCF